MLKNYTVLEANIEKLNTMIEKINKRAKKINQTEISYTIDKEYFVDLNKDNKLEATENIVKYFDITLNAEPIKITGYTILASINHTYESGNIIKTLSDKEIPEKYKTIDGICEHCNTNRRRKETVLLQNEQGNIIQIGKSCLKDYLGYDINDKLSYMDLLTEIENEDFTTISNIDGVKFAKYINTMKLLNISNLLIKSFGYVKTKNEYGERNTNNTKDRTLNLYCENNIYRTTISGQQMYTNEEIAIYNTINSANYKDDEVIEAIGWIKQQNNNSDYINNLQVLANNEYINYKETGILCSFMVCYYKVQEHEQKQKKQTEQIKNEYVGTVGEKIQTELTLKNEFNFETQWGISHIYIFKDAEGHEYKWNSSKSIETEKQEKAIIKGTIKAQEEYKGIKQTILTRCKIIDK